MPPTLPQTAPRVPYCAGHCHDGFDACPTPHMCALQGWPFGRLTDQQRRERFDFEIAAKRNELRGLPSVFGALA